MTEQFSNAAQTTLNGGIGSGDLTLVVASAANFPGSGNFRVLIESEILVVTGVAGTTFTVLRAQEGTSAISHPSGAAVTGILTAGALAQLKADVSASSRIIYDLQKGVAVDATGVATTIGAAYVDASGWPSSRTVKFRCILETTNAVAGYEATADLFDTADSLGGGSPAPVAGSQVDNSGATTKTVAFMCEATCTAAFAAFSGAGVFEARLWIATAAGGNSVTCKSAQLIVE